MVNRSVVNPLFWKDKKVFLTGHTGFKGSWLSLWLHAMGAQVTGYALQPATTPNLYELCNLNTFIHKSIIADIRDIHTLTQAMQQSKAEIVIHMAAQPLVRESYNNPVDTYSINVMGTVNVLESVRQSPDVTTVINVTTDKCYENKEWAWGYRENEPLGGYDPYSSSKACSELITSAYRDSFLHHASTNRAPVAIASARAGNVIGGGDWAIDRLIPDCVRSILANETIKIRSPHSIRPWQHVLEPLNGYLTLAEKLYTEGTAYASAWNFGPHDTDVKPVEWIVNELCNQWGQESGYELEVTPQPHEAQYLKLDCSKANSLLHWYPKWNLQKALQKIIEWNLAYTANKNMYDVCLKQIEEFQNH